MIGQAQKSEVRKSIRETIQKIVAIKGEDLARTEEFGKELSFESGAKLFDIIIDFFGRFTHVDFSFLPKSKMTEVQQACSDIYIVFEVIQNVSLLRESNPIVERDKILKHLEDTFGRHINLLTSILAASPQETLSIQTKMQDADRILQDMKKVKTQIEEEVLGIRSTMDATLSEVQKMAAIAGVSAHAVHFDEEAKRYEESSRKWLRRTVSIAGLALLLTLGIVWHSICFDFSIGQSIRMAIAKITVLAVIYSCMIWSGKIYRSERHNWIVNRHRCNALLTFKTFASATSDKVTKNAVLLQATESIFGHQPSGFSEKSQDSGTPKILEVFRNLTSGPSSSD